MWFTPPHFTLHRRPKARVATSGGERWLDALSEQLRGTEESIPVLAAAHSDLQEVDVSSISTLQVAVLGWHMAMADAARAVLGARLSRAAPVFAV